MDLRKGSVPVCLLRYSVPIMITLVMHQAYSIVDTIIVARFCSENDLAVISSASMVFSFLYNVLTGVAVGVGILAGLQYGGEKFQQQIDLAKTSIICALSLGTLIAVGTICMAHPLLVLLQVPTAILEKSMKVLRLYGLGLLFYAMIACTTSQINGTGNSKVTLIFGLSFGGLNILLDCIFVLGLGTDVIGTVYASLICQMLQMLFSLAYLNKLLPKGYTGSFSLKLIGISVKLSAGAILQTISVSLALVVVQALINSAGISYINGASVALLTYSLLNNCINGFAQGYQGFLSVNTGARCSDRICSGDRWGTVMGLFLSALVAVSIYHVIRPVACIMLGTGDSIAIAFAASYCMCLLPFFPCAALSQLAGARLRVNGETRIFVYSAMLYGLLTVLGSLQISRISVLYISAAQTGAKLLEMLILCFYSFRVCHKDEG